jgi:hypothetical protein
MTAQAQTQITGNVVYSTVNPAPQGASYSWSGFQVTESTGGGLSGGHVPGYNISTGQFMFGYAPGTIGYAIALNSVLSGTGIQLGGIEYGMQYFNQDYSRGTLSATINLLNKQGSVLESYYHSLPQTTNGWTNFDQVKTFTNPYLLSNIGNATATITGQDDRFWAGYYGPQFRNPYMRFSYVADICAANPLSSPECPGYATAFLNQQCTISALYNPACSGYAAAYFTQQCTANPLSDPACPGYAQAYKTQQCSINPLYATDCPGYAQAYFNQQCQANGLYSTSCPNYAEAYAKKNILNIGTTTTTTATATAVVTESTTSTAKTDPISIATTNTTTSTTSPTSVTSVTSVVSGGSTNATTAAVTSTQSTAQSSTTTTSTTAAPTSTETRKTDTEIKSATSTSSSRDDMKGRVEARAKEVARAGAEAKSFEAQTAVQGTVVALMGFVPGFDAYGTARIIDINGQQMARLYGRATVDNRAALRGLTGASDRLHSDMVDQQYQLGR